MKKLHWFSALKQLPRLVVFSFAVALVVFIFISIGSIVFSGGKHAFDTNEARFVFITVFIVSLIYLFVKALVRAKSGPV